jgi:uncharacterized membrane protein
MDTGVHAAASESDFNLTLKRNCSISPRALLWLLGLVMLQSLGIGAGFAWIGAWMILPFAGLEMLALAAAFYVNGRHAADYERIALEGGYLVVEVCDADRLARHEFNPAWVRFDELRSGREYRVTLRARGNALEIGRHLDAERRASLVLQLRQGLSNC